MYSLARINPISETVCSRWLLEPNVRTLDSGRRQSQKWCLRVKDLCRVIKGSGKLNDQGRGHGVRGHCVGFVTGGDVAQIH